MNRVILSSIISLLLIALLAVGYFYYTSYRENFSKPEVALPPDASFFVSGNLKQLTNDLTQLSFWKEADSSMMVGEIKKDMALLMQNTEAQAEVADLMEAKNAIISFHVTGSEKIDALYLMPVKPDMSIQAMQKTLRGNRAIGNENHVRVFAGVDIYELAFPDIKKTFTFAISGSIFIGSFTSFLVEDAIRQQGTGKTFGGNKNFEKQYEEALTQSGFALCINYAKFKNLLGSVIKNENLYKLNELERWASWSVQNVDINKNSLSAQGVFDLQDTTLILSSFTNCNPVKNSVTDVLPASTVAFQSFVFGNCNMWLTSYRSKINDGDAVNAAEVAIKKFEQNVKVPVRQKFVSLLTSDVTLAITGTPTTLYENNVLAFFKLNNPTKAAVTLKALAILYDGKNKKTPTEDYKKHEIGFIPADGLLPAIFGNSFSMMRKSFYTIHGNYLVMANRASTLRVYIEEVQNKNLFKDTKSFAAITSQLSQPCNYVLYVNPVAMLPIWQNLANNKNSIIPSTRQDYFKTFTSFSYIVSKNEKGQTTCSSLINFGTREEKKNAQQLWVYFADTVLYSGPYLFLKDDEQFTLMQDAAGTLLCADKGGNIKWRLPLDGLIQGQINQTPDNESGMLQFIFCTDKKIFVVDELGNLNSKYPLRLPAQTVSGIYADRQSPYYFIPCTNRQLYVYDYAGRPAPGFNYVKTDGNVAGNININTTSGMVYFMDDANNLYAYATDGTLKLKTPLAQAPAGNSISIVADSIPYFVSSDSAGTIYTNNLNKTSSQKTITSAQTGLDYAYVDVTGDKTPEHIILHQHDLSIFDNNLSLIGQLNITHNFNPGIQVIRRNNKNFIAVSSNADSLYITNGKAALLKGFPFSATSFTIKAGNKMVYVVSRDKDDKVKATGLVE